VAREGKVKAGQRSRGGRQRVPRRWADPWGRPPWKVEFRPEARDLADHVDIAIVGGGFSGLAAAAWLRRMDRKRSVLVLESGSIGEGASGRTGGLALAETAAGKLPGLGDVLAGYEDILRTFGIDGGLALSDVWEIGRSAGMKDSPIRWQDSGGLRVVRQVPGGTVDPGKVVAGLARSAEKAGAQIAEQAEVRGLDFANPAGVQVLRRVRGRVQRKTIRAEQVLLATNAFSLEMAGVREVAEPKLTFALATEPLSAAQLKAIGFASRRPFYTIDFPYLWGRLLETNGVIFGAGLVPALIGWPIAGAGSHLRKKRTPDLRRFDVQRGEAAERLQWLEDRVRQSASGTCFRADHAPLGWTNSAH
jgi:glycine/D-amino acid oxidase-like deaminating enzyme